MKKIVVLSLFMLVLISCSTEQISKHDLESSTGGKSGVIILENGDSMYFKSAFVLVSRKSVMITDEDTSHEFLWRKIRTLHIFNTVKQDDYILQLKAIEKFNKGTVK